MPVTADIDNVDVALGRYFSQSENDAAMRVAFLGMDVANASFQPARTPALARRFMSPGCPIE